MAKNKPRPTLADYFATAIGPALIIGLVVSLIYFLLEIFYVGQYALRLQWIFFWFILAAVMIARLAVTQGLSERSLLYGPVLGLVVFVALQFLVEYPEGSIQARLSWVVNLGLMGIVWWSAHKLTLDCTHIDERVDSSGAGVLEAAGLEGPAPATSETNAGEPSAKGESKRGSNSAFVSWFKRYRAYQERRKGQPQTPGVWIVYFSLAALPLFGLGQSLIPAGDVSRRRYAFWLMGAYVASALGLLLTTSFLGLRRYLRQRRLEMPAAVAGVWLAAGAALIVLLLGLGAFLPRPNAEYPLVNLGPLAGSADHDASRYAVLRDGKAKGQGKASANQQSRGQSGQRTPGQQGQQGNNKGDSQSQSQSQDGSKSGSKDQSGNDRSQAGDQKSSSSQKSDNDAQNSGQERDRANSADKQSSGDRSKNPDEQKEEGRSADEKSDNSRSEDGASTPPPPPVFELLMSLAPVIKWIVFGIVALIVGFAVLRTVLKFMANFTGWARGVLAALERLWQVLFGWLWAEPGRAKEAARAAVPPRPPRPFSSFRNPFWNGGAHFQSAEEITRYSFQALEAWGREHGLGREVNETPLEFGGRVGDAVPTLEELSRRLVTLYARAAYARAPLGNSCLPVLREFWDRLEAVVEAPLSA